MRRLTAPLLATIAIYTLAFGTSAAWAIAPTISAERISAPTTTSATLEAEVNPNGKATAYRFEYGLSDCATSSCTKVPVPDAVLPATVKGSGDLAKGSTKVTSLATTEGTFTVGQTIQGTGIPAATTIVSVAATELTLSKAATADATGTALTATGPQHIEAALGGLTPGTIYHFRVIAKNADGETKGPDRTFMTYQLPQVFGACPNDALRLNNPAKVRIDHSSANLPDCRVYEQATPIDKGAGDATGTVPFVRSSDAGGQIVYLSVSGVPGGVGSQDFPVYLASRGGSAWSTNGLLPHADFGQNARVLGWTPDFTDVFTRAFKLGEEPPMTKMLATPPGGESTSLTPSYVKGLAPFYAGASAGGQEVIFESKAAIPGVPGAIEGRSNVYLWEKASGELSLASAMNDGNAPPAGAFAGPYDWINGTNPKSLANGGAARGYYTQPLGAISKDGSAVYFTAAGTGQLYVRLNPSEAQSATDLDGKCTQPALACTVRVSESKRTPPDPAGDRPAAFHGASTDGTKALFTSSQMLTDDANTGPEQEPAAIEVASRADGAGRKSCVPTHATGVAVDAEHIYWVNLDANVIARAKLNCTDVDPVFLIPPELEVEPGLTLPATLRGVGVFGDAIYWTNGEAVVEGEGEDPDKLFEGTIGKAKLNGTGAATEVDPDFITGAGNPHAVAANTVHVFWTNDPRRPEDVKSGLIGRAKATDGGEVLPELVTSFNSADEQPEIALDAGHVYWTERVLAGHSRISRADFDGSKYTINFIFVGLNTKAKGLTVFGDQIYWTDQTTETIGRAKLNGDEPASEVQPGFISAANNPGGIAADATTLYWATNGEAPPNPGNDLYLFDAKAGSLTDLAPDSVAVKGVEVQGVLGASADLSHVYFAANGVPAGVEGSPNARGEAATLGTCKGTLALGASGVCNVYDLLADLIRFIARLDVGGSQSDAANWAATRFPAGTFSGDFQKTARLSADGQTLLFRSQRQLTAYDNKGVAQLYLYRAGAEEIVCVSCNPTGAAPRTEVPPRFGAIKPPVVIPTPPAATLTHSLSADGTRVFFETTERLVGTDTNGEDAEGKLKCPPVGADLQAFPACLDTYEWEALGTGSCTPERVLPSGGCLYLISTGEGDEPGMIADASADGTDVFFFTRAQLVGQDEDNLQDIYTARAGGGLAAQNPPPPNPCLATESCRPSEPRPLPPPDPPKFQGQGNPKAPRVCPKGKRKVKGRCVPKKRKAAKKQRRGGKGKGKANANRRQRR